MQQNPFRKTGPFKYFDNSKTVLEIVEQHFPVQDKINLYKEKKKSISNIDKYINFELGRIKRCYDLKRNSKMPAPYLGYVLKKQGYDDQLLSTIDSFFLVWKESLSELELAELKTNLEPNNPDELEQKLEYQFLELYSIGINDATFEEFLKEELEILEYEMATSKVSNDQVEEEEEEEDVPMELENAAQKIAWMYELEVLQPIFKKCTVNGTINIKRAAEIIHYFLDNVTKETIRKAIEGIIHDTKNNPLKSKKTKATIDYMRKMLLGNTNQ